VQYILCKSIGRQHHGSLDNEFDGVNVIRIVITLVISDKLVNYVEILCDMTCVLGIPTTFNLHFSLSLLLMYAHIKPQLN